MSNLLEMKDIVFIDENGEAQAGVDLTIDTCDFSITLPIDTRRMNKEKVEKLIEEIENEN